MKILAALGVLAGVFLLSPPPRSVALALLWLGARAHPVITICCAGCRSRVDWRLGLAVLLTSQLSRHVGKLERHWGLGLEALTTTGRFWRIMS